MGVDVYSMSEVVARDEQPLLLWRRPFHLPENRKLISWHTLDKWALALGCCFYVLHWNPCFAAI